ncbi:hypothetical protein DFH09DRAFT_1274460 [Mycena vulgaris]|nr:hypothetical protein DFH09DRAFT_1274460 [Mycena vulgaris]
MHRGLGVPEVVQLICAQFATGALNPLSDAAEHDLSVLGARTSRTFLNPALNVLWSHQNTILNLLRCMPADVWDVTKEKIEAYGATVTTHIRLQRTIVSSDWERPLFYGHRVRSFNGLMDLLLKDTAFFETLTLCLPGDFIFPNLQKMDWYPQLPETFHHVHLFLAPTLKQLFLSSIKTFSHLSVLSNLAVKCPGLTTVTIKAHNMDDLALPIISGLVRELRHIESLDVPGLDEAAFVYLAQLPGLRSLGFHSAETPNPFFQSSGNSVDFPALIHLTTPTMEAATALLAILPNRPFQTLSINRTPIHCTHIARQFYSALAKRCSHSSLRALNIHYDAWENNDDALSAEDIAMYSVGPDILLPLFSFDHLVNVVLVHPVGFDIDDATVRTMARAWPRIEILSLRAGPLRHVPPRLTLEGLSAFAEYCPHLSTLAITFDATLVPTRRGPTKTARVCQGSLRTLAVSLSLISKPGRVAVFLSAIFPELRWIETCYDDTLDAEEGEVDVIIPEPETVASHALWKDVEDALDSDF